MLWQFGPAAVDSLVSVGDKTKMDCFCLWPWHDLFISLFKLSLPSFRLPPRPPHKTSDSRAIQEQGVGRTSPPPDGRVRLNTPAGRGLRASQASIKKSRSVRRTECHLTYPGSCGGGGRSALGGDHCGSIGLREHTACTARLSGRPLGGTHGRTDRSGGGTYRAHAGHGRLTADSHLPKN